MITPLTVRLPPWFGFGAPEPGTGGKIDPCGLFGSLPLFCGPLTGAMNGLVGALFGAVPPCS